MSQFVIPSVFKAVDRMTAPMRKMTRGVSNFGKRAEIAVAKAERRFRKLTPKIGGATKQLFAFASGAALVGGALALMSFSTGEIIKYEE